MYDAIIIGARCAGATTAMLLARRGYRVLCVDRATFPSDTISGHFIMHPGVRKLHEWGLLDAVIASGCPPVTTWATDFGDFLLKGEVATGNSLPAAIAPRRTVLDKILVDAAVAAGAEVREGFAVSGLLTEGDRVVGIRGRTTTGTMVEERTHIVIGADGKHSRMAEWVQAPRYMEHPTLTCWYGSYWRDLPCEGLELHWRPHRVIIAFPTHDGLTGAFAGWPIREFHLFRSDIEGNINATFAMMTSLADRLEGASRAERHIGYADLPNYFRRPYGPGWALVGDAGHHKDPVLARGMTDAFLDADLLADAVDAGLSGQQPLQDALANYEQQRNARAIPDNEQNLKMAHLTGLDTPEVLGLRAALRHNPMDTARFNAVRALALPAAEFFHPANLQRIMQQAQPQAARAAVPA